jgi:hypothetical protein
MLGLRGVEKICRSELTLPARLGRQDKSNGAWARLSHCLHIQDLLTLARYVAPQGALVARGSSLMSSAYSVWVFVRKTPKSHWQ